PDWNWKRFFTAASSDGMCRDYMNHLRRNMSRLSSSGRLALIRKAFEGCSGSARKAGSKTHDLVKLLTEVGEFVPELLPYEDQLEEVSEYGVAVRYPNGFAEPTLDESRRAYEAARKVPELVLQKMNL
ncbi:HEPN domain-containing protein, partial [Geomonas sp. Red276]